MARAGCGVSRPFRSLCFCSGMRLLSCLPPRDTSGGKPWQHFLCAWVVTLILRSPFRAFLHKTDLRFANEWAIILHCRLIIFPAISCFRSPSGWRRPGCVAGMRWHSGLKKGGEASDWSGIKKIRDLWGHTVFIHDSQSVRVAGGVMPAPNRMVFLGSRACDGLLSAHSCPCPCFLAATPLCCPPPHSQCRQTAGERRPVSGTSGGQQ